ncbi:hypothetical protein VPH35_120602 [Triticum aestivum]
MGKRKVSAKPPTRKRMDKLDMAFSCPFCNHGSSGWTSSVECLIDMKNLTGEANCQICQESFSTTANGTSKSYIKLHIVPPNIAVDAILIGSQLENYAPGTSFGFVPSQPNDCNSGNGL